MTRTIEVPESEWRELRREISETRVMVEGLAKGLSGRDQQGMAEYLREVKSYLFRRRLDAGLDIYKTGIQGKAAQSLWDADLLTVEEIATRTRQDVAGLPGVGRTSIGRIEAAMAERGLSWAEAS